MRTVQVTPPAPSALLVLLLVLSLALALSACSLLESAPEPTPEPEPPASDGLGHIDDPPRPYFAGEADLPLYEDPNFGSEVKARLALNEEVLRHMVHQGFAYVTVVQNGLQGWVENAALAWKKLPPPALPEGEDIPPDSGPRELGTDSGGPISETF